MSSTPASCEVMTLAATDAGKLDVGAGRSMVPGGVVSPRAVEDSREEDNGEASDEASRRESNSSTDGNEHLETQQPNNEDQDRTNMDLLDNNITTQNTPRKRKKKRRSRRKSTHSRTNSLQHITPNPITDPGPTAETNTPQLNTSKPDRTNTSQNQGATNEQIADTYINIEITDEGTTESVTDDGTTSGNTTEDGTTDKWPIPDGTADKWPLGTNTTNNETTSDSNPSPLGTPRASSSSSSSTTTTGFEITHIPQHLLDLTPPPTRGRSNAFYGNKLPPPLVHSHSDGAAILAQHTLSSSRRNTVGLGGVIVTPTIPEPAHSGLSKPKMFTWRNFSGQTAEKAVLSHSKRFLVGFAETIGRRPSMEDCMVVHGAFRGRGHEDYFALFDGHGGKAAAAFAAEHLHQILAEKLKTNNAVKSLKEAFADTNRMISDQKIIGGTTAVVALFIGRKGFIANVGDTRAVLCRDGVPLRVSLDHKPELPTETSRIKELGGTVTTSVNSAGHAISRVNGQLAVSRALGDTPLHPYVSSDPEIHGPLNLDTEARNQFVVLACDGVWDVLTDEEATRIVAPIANPEIASRRLRDEAFARGSTDNISVMVIRCPPFVPCD